MLAGSFSLATAARVRALTGVVFHSVPGAYFDLVERKTEDHGWTFKFTGEKKKYLNLGSYNYLGFAESEGPCAQDSIRATEQYGVSCCSPRSELGTTKLHEELESLVAQFVHKPAALTFGMGFATNATNMPLFVGKGCLIISDAFNHTSLVLGARLSGAKIRVFKHNGGCPSRLAREPRLRHPGLCFASARHTSGEQMGWPTVPWSRCMAAFLARPLSASFSPTISPCTAIV